MTERRDITIHFNDGTRLGFTFPQQVGSDHMVSRMQKQMEGRWLALEVEGDLFMIPVDSIKYIQGHPAPEKLPDTVIRGARMTLD